MTARNESSAPGGTTVSTTRPRTRSRKEILEPVLAQLKQNLDRLKQFDPKVGKSRDAIELAKMYEAAVLSAL